MDLDLLSYLMIYLQTKTITCKTKLSISADLCLKLISRALKLTPSNPQGQSKPLDPDASLRLPRVNVLTLVLKMGKFV
ncbi:hypothetical protein Y032_0111g237 [Ancylostoma ceylanicum]|uniref:Uncharacterized protein n=1 Tax=Ancylostoma ceylanicum TaxID=53326 RepID=A0A016TEE4_9BILA|nr:hypothetical protein Y032_0111g237 [Ancylostoma ceylanicum]